MATNMQDYSPINSLQKMVDTIPNDNASKTGSEKKKHKKHKKKENMPPPPPSPLPQLQTTPAFAPNELLKEMGFDISPTTSTSSNSTVSPPSWMGRSMISTFVSFISATSYCSKPCPTCNGT